MAKHKAPDPKSLPTWREFTREIFDTWDADPGYYALQFTPMPTAQMYRAAVAWCTYYNLGIAADASEYRGEKFWDYLEGLYDTAKRATERRHFRGNAGKNALRQWRTNWPEPEALVEYMCENGTSYFQIRKRGSQVMQYGDYFYWKWCDLNEVLGYGPVDMQNSARYSPKTPQQGAELIYCIQNQLSEVDEFYDVGAQYAQISRYGRLMEVPPRTTGSRVFGIQEAETVCCVYKQMHSGSYTYGTRTAKAVNRLGAASSQTAKKMRTTLLDLTPFSEAELSSALASLKK